MPINPAARDSTTIYTHALAFYKLMQDTAVPTDVEGTELSTYTGAITKLFSTLRISQAYYTLVTAFLKNSGCISMIKRGARNSLSIVALHHEPTVEDWNIYKENFQVVEKEKRTDIAILQAQVKELQDWQKAVLDFKAVAINFENRLANLENNTQGEK